MVGDYRTVLFH